MEQEQKLGQEQELKQQQDLSEQQLELEQDQQEISECFPKRSVSPTS